MKQRKAIIFTAILTLLAFGAVVYTSCRKDRCKKLNCQHGGTCSDGYCICPTGYTGTYCQVANVSEIAFKNRTFTPVTLYVNGYEHTVDTGKTLIFSGSHGDTLRCSAKTHGTYGLNVPLTTLVSKEVFPARGTTTLDLDVSVEYFFLMATNTNPTVPYISKVYVNYKQPDETLDVIEYPDHQGILNNGKNYYIGYYKANTNTIVRLEKTPIAWTYNNLGFVPAKNQYYNAVTY